ncbi:MAG: bile acid:sodium symporter, partial [Planctomycetota bacterium]
LVGWFGGGLIEPLAQSGTFRWWLVFVVMLAMTSTMPSWDRRQGRADSLGIVLASSLNALVVPALGLLVAWSLQSWVGDRLSAGVYVATLMPCTLASATVWSRRCGGSEAVAMGTTIVTNLAAVLVIPIGLLWVPGISLTDAPEIGSPVAKLLGLIVLPLVIGRSIRRVALIESQIERHRTKLRLFSQFGILVMVALGASHSRQATALESFSLGILAVTILATGVTHWIAIWGALQASKRTGLPRATVIACGIAGSQKTIMIGLQVAIDLGVSVVPMMVYHATQLVVDEWMVRDAKIETRDENSG